LERRTLEPSAGQAPQREVADQRAARHEGHHRQRATRTLGTVPTAFADAAAPETRLIHFRLYSAAVLAQARGPAWSASSIAPLLRRRGRPAELFSQPDNPP